MSTAACSVGFIQTTLEPHLATLDPPLTSLQVSKFLAVFLLILSGMFQIGAFFMVMGGSYGLSLPLWGFLCDLKVAQFSFCPTSHSDISQVPRLSVS